MTKKLVAFDIDGTLLTSNHRYLTSTKKVIQKLRKQGHFVTVATGRSYLTAKAYIEEGGFEHYILCNGSYAFIENKLAYTNPLDKSDLEKLISLANREKIDMIYQTMHEVKQPERFFHQATQDIQDNYQGVKPTIGFDVANDEIYQAVVFSKRETEHHFHDQFESIRFTRWGEEAMDAVPMGASKAETLKYIAKEQCIKEENIIVFGDGENDIEMLQFAGLGIAMGNASEYVKSFADYVTTSNDEDGIWQAADKLKII